MTETLYEWEGTWEELEKHAPELRGKRLRLTVVPQDAAGSDSRPSENRSDERTEAGRRAGDEPSPQAAPGSIEAAILKRASHIPEEEWRRVPPDLTDQLDHYIYGTPKR